MVEFTWDKSNCNELADFVRSPTPPPLSATKSFGLLPPSRPSTAPKLL